MGKHILKCECGKEHDISEIFGQAVENWIKEDDKTMKQLKNKKKLIRI